MYTRDLLARRGRREMVFDQRIESGSDQAVLHGVEPLRAFGVVWPHRMQAARGMGDVRGGHGYSVGQPRRDERRRGLGVERSVARRER
jgi:hypothetical protein